jgi:hypothetical protein
MRYIVTIGELMDIGLWQEYCEATGRNPYCVNEGLADRDDELDINSDLAVELGID